MPVMLCVLLRNWRVVNVKNVTCAMVARVRHAAMRHPRNRIMKHRTGSHSEAHVSNHHGHHAPALSRVKADDLRRPYGCTLCSLWFETEEETISVIAATPTRGAICKMVVHVRCRDGRPMPSRKFLWTLQQERRPPQVGCWLISSVLALDRALNELTM